MMQHVRSVTYIHHTVTLGALTREGDALAEIAEADEQGILHSRLVSVPAGLPGERVTIAVEVLEPPRAGRRRHRRHWKPRPPRVEITEIHQPSPIRIQASCPVFGSCGGCQLQHMQYAAQLLWKRSIVEQLLRDVGGFENPPLRETVACETPWHYRNHMRFSVNRHGQLGLTARGTHRVLPLTSCPIAHTYINTALSVLSQQNNAQPQVLIRCGDATGHILLQPQPGPEVAQQLSEAGLNLHTETMEEILGGETFRIRPSSFFQTNTLQAEKMLQMVLDGFLNITRQPTTDSPMVSVLERRNTVNFSSADVSVECRFIQHEVANGYRKVENADEQFANAHLTIADAYCGVGTFALLLARHVGKVIAVEESASAIKDAQWNLREVSNVEIVKGKVEEVLPMLAPQLDGLVIDPPRAGCQQVVLDALVQNPIARIVYVSCDPATLARDLNILCHLHPVYQLHSVQPLDMFPQTAHIECVAILERK